MLTKNYSTEIANVIKQSLINGEVKFTFDEEKGTFLFNTGLDGKISNVRCVIRVHEDDFVTFLYLPLNADRNDSKMLAKIAEFICRINYGSVCHCFELDMNDGEIRCKYFVDCQDITPSLNMVENSIGTLLVAMERYAEGFAYIIFGGATAKEAMIKCDRDADDLDELYNFINDEIEAGKSIDSIIETISKKKKSKDCTPDDSDLTD